MRNSTNFFSGFDLDKLQSKFNTDFNHLEQSNDDDLNYIEQCHFGGMLIEKTDYDGERYKLWRKLDCNGGGILVEYCGAANDYIWETVYES